MVAPAYILGGLMQGGGQAAQQVGAMKRDEILRMISEARADSRSAASDDRQDKRAALSDQNATDRQTAELAQRDKENTQRLSLYDKTVDLKGPDGKVHTYGFNGKDKIDLGEAPPPKATERSRRLVQVDDPDNPGQTIYVDADEAVGMSAPKTKAQNEQAAADEQDARSIAQQAAKKEADAQGGYPAWMGGDSDAKDFAADGGDREAFIKRRTEELLKDPNSVDSKAAAPAADDAAPAAEAKPKATPKGGKGKAEADSQVKTEVPFGADGKPDAAKLVKNKTYTLPNGQPAKWTGAGFEAVNP